MIVKCFVGGGGGGKAQLFTLCRVIRLCTKGGRDIITFIRERERERERGGGREGERACRGLSQVGVFLSHRAAWTTALNAPFTLRLDL